MEKKNKEYEKNIKELKEMIKNNFRTTKYKNIRKAKGIN